MLPQAETPAAKHSGKRLSLACITRVAYQFINCFHMELQSNPPWHLVRWGLFLPVFLNRKQKLNDLLKAWKLLRSRGRRELRIQRPSLLSVPRSPKEMLIFALNHSVIHQQILWKALRARPFLGLHYKFSLWRTWGYTGCLTYWYFLTLANTPGREGGVDHTGNHWATEKPSLPWLWGGIWPKSTNQSIPHHSPLPLISPGEGMSARWGQLIFFFHGEGIDKDTGSVRKPCSWDPGTLRSGDAKVFDEGWREHAWKRRQYKTVQMQEKRESPYDTTQEHPPSPCSAWNKGHPSEFPWANKVALGLNCFDLKFGTRQPREASFTAVCEDQCQTPLPAQQGLTCPGIFPLPCSPILAPAPRSSSLLSLNTPGILCTCWALCPGPAPSPSTSYFLQVCIQHTFSGRTAAVTSHSLTFLLRGRQSISHIKPGTTVRGQRSWTCSHLGVCYSPLLLPTCQSEAFNFQVWVWAPSPISGLPLSRVAWLHLVT